MKKQILMLSAAVGALISGPALAATTPDYTDITTAITKPVDTAHATPGDPTGTPGDILLGSTTSGTTTTYGSITVTTSGTPTTPQPAVTINSNNSFNAITGTTISNKNTVDAVGTLVDLTTNSWDATNDMASCGAAPIPCHTTEGIIEAGTIDMGGTGNTKRGLWLEGPTTGTTVNSFTGNIDMTGSTMTITGDSSVGVLIDKLAALDGNLTLGAITISPTSSTSTAGVTGLQVDGVVNGDVTQAGSLTVTGSKTTTGGLYGWLLNGTINGNMTIADASVIGVAGTNATGVLLTGSINAGGCDASTPPVCTSLGSFINNGTISVVGQTTAATASTGNPVSAEAVGIGGSIAGGFYNAGPLSSVDTTAAATISAQSTTAAILISPTLQTATTQVPIVIGIYGSDTTDPGFSFYNRGGISEAPANLNQSATTILIQGNTATVNTVLTGGLYNSGNISSSAASSASTISGHAAVSATALAIGGYASIGPGDTYDISTCQPLLGTCTYNGTSTAKTGANDLAALVNSGSGTAGTGTISANISGPMGGQATAIIIASTATVPSLINSGTISAIATTTDLTISNLAATAIVDQSGSLTYIQNNGVISASVTTLNNGLQVAKAIDLSADTATSAAGTGGVAIIDQATAKSGASITGNILFGTGDRQIVTVLGANTSNLASIVGDISFGGGTTFGSDSLTIGEFGTVLGRVTAVNGVDVDVENGGTLILANDKLSLNSNDFVVKTGGTLDLTVLEQFTSGIVTSKEMAALDSGAKLNIAYGSFVPQGTSNFVLMSAPTGQLMVADTNAYNVQLAATLPYLFESATLNTITTPNGLTDELVLTVIPKTAAQLGFTPGSYAAQLLPFVNQALGNDDILGASMLGGITDKASAQRAYGQFAPDVTGGVRAIAVSLTDQATGPVAARQRMLRLYGKESGEATLWGEEFAEFLKDPGNTDTGQTGFKDHGFGFVLGLDGGEPRTGWYGGAFSFYSGDVTEPSPRNDHSNSLWYMLSGYTDWRGRGLFLDTKVDVGYVSIKEKRFLDLTIPNSTGSTNFIDEADSKRPGIVGSAGFTSGVILAYGSTTITPQFSLDGMTMREEGYTETHGSGVATGNGKGFDLAVQSYYASSLRAFLGTEIREDLNLGDFFLQPDIRLGYRYDFLDDPVKLKAAFADVGTLSTPTLGPQFTVTGPDPSQGNFVAGAAIAATTDAWTLGANFDFVRGTNGATEEVGTLHLLGRI